MRVVSDLIREAAQRHPESAAIAQGSRNVSYGRLLGMASDACSIMRDAGLRPGGRVLLMWENGPEYAALFFGTLLAGGVVIPLNPANYPEYVRFVANHSGASFAAVTERSVGNLDGWWNGAPILTRFGDGKRTVGLGDLPGTAPEILDGPGEARGDDLAMVLYTSGTTGEPKGVMLSHRNLLSNTKSILGYLPLVPGDRTLAILPFYYSYGNSLLLTHAAAGAALVIENRFAFVNKALETMRESAATGFSGVPSHYSILINRSRFLEDKWPRLRYMTCAGGALPLVHIRRIRDALPHVALHVMYGQTEGTARLSSLDPCLLDVKTGSIGKGIPGVEVRVVDKKGSNVRPGDTGELIARGDNVMMGYLGDSDASHAALRNGWLYTGDLATVDDDGFIFIKGRAKEFIKAGGYRVSPYQIEEVLLRHPAVSECAVVGIPDDLMEERVLAVVVLRDGGAAGPTTASVMDHARGNLPLYMVPSAIEAVDGIPKTESGKVRRTELRSRFVKSAGPA